MNTFTGWHKSTYSGGNDECVEQGITPDGAVVGVRDTKWEEGTSPILSVSPAAWQAFTATLANPAA